MQLKKIYLNLISSIYQDDYWHGGHISRCQKSEWLSGLYYVDLTKKCLANDYINCPLDVFVPKVTNQYGSFFHPVTLCQVGLGCFDYYKVNNSKEHLCRAIKCADWLIDNIYVSTENSNTLYRWHVPYAFKLFSLEKNFYSGLIQGQATSLLLRIYMVTNKKKYLNYAIYSIDTMLLPIDSGGCYNEKYGIIEEYCGGELVSVLNGAISSLWAINDFNQLSISKNYVNVFNKLNNNLKRILPNYDSGIWSKYCLKENDFFYNSFASPYYHLEHISQLEVLYHMTDDYIYSHYSNIYKNYYTKFFIRCYVITRKGISRIIQRLFKLV